MTVTTQKKMKNYKLWNPVRGTSCHRRRCHDGDATIHTGIFKGCGYSSRLWLQFLKDVATGKNGRFAREFSGKSTTNAHFTEIMLSMPI